MPEWAFEPKGVFSTVGQGLYSISGNRNTALMDIITELRAQVTDLNQQLSAALPYNIKVGPRVTFPF